MAGIEQTAADDVEIVDERREILESQFAAIENAAESPPAADPAPGQARGADGRFAQGAQENAPTGQKTGQDPVAEEPLWARPPRSWKKDNYDIWHAADPRLKEIYHAREDEMQAGVETARVKAVAYDHIARAMEPYMSTVRGLGLEPAAAIKGLMEADHILRTSEPGKKRAYLLQLADHYGISLGDVSGHTPTEGAMNPHLYALQNEINSVRGEVAGWKEAQETAINESLLQDIANFAKGKEHFEEVRPVMSKLLQAGLASSLQDAYTQALRLNEELFTADQAALQAQRDAEKREAANRAAKVARGAAVSVRGSTPGAQAVSKAQDRRSMLAEQFDSLTDRL